MARKIGARLMLQQLAAGTSRNAIARSLGVSKRSIQAVAEAAEREKVSWRDAEGMEGGGLYSRLFPEKADAAECVCLDPGWDAIHREPRKTGVTLRLLHGEYADAPRAEGRPWMSYDRFCKRYAGYAERRNVVSRVGHKAGRTLEVDWAGPTMQLVGPMSSEVSKACLFVAALPFSRYSYAEPTLDMKQDAWLRCHVHAFAFFGGCTPIIVPDNLLTGVRKHPKGGEAVLNEAYRELAACMGMPFGQRIQMAVDEAHAGYVADKIRNLVKRSNLRYPQADVRRIHYAEERGLDRVLIGEPATCGFATRGQDVVLFGPAGTGKTYLACALAKEACASRMRTNYIRCPDLEGAWKDAQERPGGVAKAVRKYGAFQSSSSTNGCSAGQTTASGASCSRSSSSATTRGRRSSAPSTGRRTGMPGSVPMSRPRRSWTASSTKPHGSTWERRTCVLPSGQQHLSAPDPDALSWGLMRGRCCTAPPPVPIRDAAGAESQ